MTIGLLFWILYVIGFALWLVLGFGWWTWLLVAVLLFLLGWKCFGFVVRDN